MSAIAARVLAWFDRHGRHDLPWQHPRSAYRVWISETMLQQTQVATVIPYFLRFVDELPDIAALAGAPLDQVLALWSGLGYYSRARRLHDAAKACMRDHGGELPRDFDALLGLPGIGRSTAGAILSLAHGLPWPILDGNVRRLLCRHRGVHGWPGSAATQKQLWRIAEDALPEARVADYTQALMDLGATVCTPSSPDCEACPLREDCIALHDDVVAWLPERKPAKPLPERETFALVVRDHEGRILLQRRPPTGVWALLWSLPEARDPDDAQAWLARHAHVHDHEVLPEIPHVFSHYRLCIRPLLWRDARARDAIGDNADLRWQACDALDDIGLPAPIRKLIEGLPRCRAPSSA
ncbi:MAG TPA: A/G-specific adenine glycosylase [Xanthomonadaceae bacterium]